MFKVIIADDEPSIKRSLKAIIERENPQFQVTAFAENGREALERVREFAPDLVFTDIRMPDMDGLMLIREIRRCGIPAEVVIITGYSDFGYAREAIRLGVFEYLLKPIDIDEVIQILKKAEKKLRDIRQEQLERSEWIAFCKKEAETMAKHLWVLNETALWSQMKQIRDRLQQYKPNFARIREMYTDLMFLLQTELETLTGNRIMLPELPEMKWNAPENTIEKQVQTIIRGVMEKIRHLRNWGSQRNMAEAIKQIENHFSDESYSLKDAAEFAGMSPTYFSKSFKEEVGMSYTRYVTKLRMQKAIELLSDPNNKVYEVAHAVGYSDYAHFAKVFKKYFQFSPTDYRHSLERSS